MIEVCQVAEWMSAQKVVVTQILVAGVIEHLLVNDNQLKYRQSVKYGNDDQIPHIPIEEIIFVNFFTRWVATILIYRYF